MRRLAQLGTGAVLLVAMLVGPGVIGAASARPTAVTAGYRLHRDIGGRGYVREDMALLENHTGYTDLDSIVWSRRGAMITLVFSSRTDGRYEATYRGTLVPRGIGTQRHPGTITDAHGPVGVFYAKNKTNPPPKP